MKIAVGSTNPAKITAVRTAIRRVWPQAEISGVDAPSGVSPMPFSDAECLRGARQRAHTARAALEADIGIGLEGGVNDEPAGLMLMGWVVVAHRDGREGVAGTARLPLPSHIAARVRAGEELGPVMDELLNASSTRQKGGAIGALTAGLVPRDQSFAMAVIYALSPFVAVHLYPTDSIQPGYQSDLGGA